jgi:hypothetical protein
VTTDVMTTGSPKALDAAEPSRLGVGVIVIIEI